MSLSAKRTLILLTIAPLAIPVFAAEGASNWTDSIRLQGDFRLRLEGIDEDGEEGRTRSRFRARFGLSAQAHDDVKVVVQLATGGDSPVSTNQTFDGGFSTKDIGVDLAYADWTATDGMHVYGGKMKNPLFKAGKVPLIWDGDLNPEGLALSYSTGAFFGTLAHFSIEERSSSDDSLLTAVQAGMKFDVGDNAKLTAGVGYFAYSDTIGNEPFYNGNAQGNTVDINGNYVYDYKNTELFVQFDTRLGDWPFQAYAHAVQNNEVSVEDTAFAVGAKLGAAKDKGMTEFSWTYQDIEADALIGTFNDSDFGGGGTDSSGHLLKGKYALSSKVSLAGSFFINDIDRFQGTEHGYDRFQLDLELKF